MSAAPRGYCPVCAKCVALRQGGLVREHRPGPNADVCPGSGGPGVRSLADVARLAAARASEGRRR